jgi:hypothetical protein
VNGLVWFWPGVVVSVVVAFALARPVSKALGSPWLVGWLLVASVGVIVAATLTPIHGPTGIDETVLRPCDLTRRGFPTLQDLDVTDVRLNVALFIPLGFAIGLLPRSRRAGLVLVAAFALPIAIEAVQYLIPTLARGCQSGDVIDDVLGLLIGLVPGLIVGAALGRRRTTAESR